MTLRQLEFAGYKAFAEKQSMALRPITLLFGHNSVGKSAALRLLPILSEAVAFRQPSLFPSVFDYQSPALRGARFIDLQNASSRSGGIHIGLQWPEAAFEATIGPGDIRDGEVVLKFSYSSSAGVMTGVLSGEAGRASYDVQTTANPTTTPLLFHGLLPYPEKSTRADVLGPALELQRLLRTFAGQVHWIGSIRSQPPRYFEFGPGMNTRIRPDGTGVAEALRGSALKGDKVAEAVSTWLKKASGSELSFAATDEQFVMGRVMVPFHLRVAERGDHHVAVPDVGEGIAQALPVVTLCRQAQAGFLGESPILALEQPELHLHPKASVCLADEIIGCVVEGSTATHVIETHSESFLLSIQIALVQKRLNPNQVVIYWVESNDGASTLRQIDFDEEGFPISGWPQGVFRETLEQARQLSQLRIG